MSFATRAQSTANRLLTKYGQVCAVTRTVKGSFDPTTGESTVSSTSTYDISCYTSNYARQEIDNILVQQNDIRLIVYSATAPEIDDVVSVDSKDYRVLDVQRIKAMGLVVMYKCQVRV